MLILHYFPWVLYAWRFDVVFDAILLFEYHTFVHTYSLVNNMKSIFFYYYYFHILDRSLVVYSCNQPSMPCRSDDLAQTYVALVGLSALLSARCLRTSCTECSVAVVVVICCSSQGQIIL